MTITRFGLTSQSESLSSYVDGQGRLTAAGWTVGTSLPTTTFGSIGLARYLGG